MLTDEQKEQIAHYKAKGYRAGDMARRMQLPLGVVREHLASIRKRAVRERASDPTPEEIAERARIEREKRTPNYYIVLPEE